MSHEIRTRLTAVGGYAELMQMGIHGPITDEQRQDLSRIQHSQRHLLGLINQILDFSRIERRVVEFESVTVLVADALAAAVHMVAPQMRARQVEYVAAECDAGITVRADPERLQQVLLNLLANATKFTNPGGRITVGCVAGDGTVSIRVSDTGIGIDGYKLEAIFTPFVQINPRESGLKDGVGLGLPISRTIARAMGGDIAVESEPGAGSTFTLTLPAS